MNVRCGIAAALLIVAAAAESQPVDVRTVAMFNQHLYYGSFSRPRGIAFDREHNEVWVADSGNSLVGIYRPDSAELYAFGPGDRLREPARITIAPEGHVVIIEGDRSHLRKFDYRGRYMGDVDLPGIGPKPILGAAAYDSKGNLYVAENRSAQIFVYTRDGKLQQQFGSRGTDEGQFEAVCGIAIDSDKTIYVLDQRAIAVQAFDDQGNFLRGWGRHEMGSENFSLPSGIAVDGRNHVIVTDELRHQVKIFSTDGKFLTQFGGLGLDAGALSFPTDVAVDGAGRIYVTERGTSRAQVFEIAVNPQR